MGTCQKLTGYYSRIMVSRGLKMDEYEKISRQSVWSVVWPPPTVIARSACDEAIQSFHKKLDCFAEFIIGRRFAPTRWLAMTKEAVTNAIRSLAPLLRGEGWGEGRLDFNVTRRPLTRIALQSGLSP
jgi:hypothetical protein